MKFEIVGKNITVTPAIREKIESKLSFLEKYFLIDEDTIARVVVRVYPNSQKIEITIPTKVGLLRTEVVHDDLYAAIDIAIDKLEDQIRTLKTRLSRKHKASLAESFYQELEDTDDSLVDEVVRTKSIVPEAMDVDEAIVRMEMLGHSFFIYTDFDTDKISVVYKRFDGGYGCIETE